MSAELLMRAAKLLREVADEARTTRTEAWHSDEIDPPYESHVYAEGDPQYASIADVVLGSCAGNYIALMHPPFALALATWLDAAAEVIQANSEEWGLLDEIGNDQTRQAAGAVAHAILRESS